MMLVSDSDVATKISVSVFIPFPLRLPFFVSLLGHARHAQLESREYLAHPSRERALGGFWCRHFKFTLLLTKAHINATESPW